MKKLVLIWTSILVVIAVAVIITTTSLAIWQRNDHANAYIRTLVTDENPSLKYQMYVPVVSSGKNSTTTTSAYSRLDGTFNVSADTYSYTLTNSALRDSIIGFSLAGWFGGVALEYIEIPDEVTVKVNGVDVTKPVVRIMPESDYTDYTFGGVNTAITDIIIGSNVIEVAAGAFYGMEYLENITLRTGDDAVYLYPYCFGGCPALRSVQNNRTSPEDWSTSMVTAGSFPLNTVTFVLYDAESVSRSYAVGSTMEEWLPTRANYKFDGWYADSGLTQAVDLYNRYAIDGDIYYAKWTEREQE